MPVTADYLTPRSYLFPEKLVKKSYKCMEPECSLPYSQELTNSSKLCTNSSVNRRTYWEPSLFVVRG